MISTDLLVAWERLLPGHADLGRELIARYDEPHRSYHTTAHLTHLLTMIDELAAPWRDDPDAVRDLQVVRLAAWFHDAVYEVGPAEPDRPTNEERSAQLAEHRLAAAGLDLATVAEIARLVRLTATHDPDPGDRRGSLLSDADLAILAVQPAAYRRYAAAVRAEYAHLDDPTFRAGRMRFLQTMITTPIFTSVAAQGLAARARANLTDELAALSAPDGHADPDHSCPTTERTTMTTQQPTPTPAAALAAAARPDGWWQSAVVYQIYPRSFADSDGDGIGDLPGITAHVDHLARLGVDVVWLSPVYPSPQDDNGYDISDYVDIDPTFGTLADFDALIAALHDRGIKLVMDLVVNHTSDEHAWFTESRDPASARRDWYWWRPARAGHEPGTVGAEPTNWSSAFSGSAWQLDEQSGDYFLHIFSTKQPDLNWENPEVRQAVYADMRFWVDRGVDGFRMDVINLISKRLPLTDGPVTPGLPYASAFGEVANGPRMDDYLAELHREVLAGKNLITVGEMPGVTVEQARTTTDPAAAEIDMVFTFEHMNLDQQPGGSKWALKPLQLTELKRNLTQWQEGLADVGWNSLYWNNHDQPRAVSRFGDDSPEFRVTSAKTLGTVLHLLKGTPYVYQGEEIGMTNHPFATIEDYEDIESVNHFHEAVGLGQDPAEVLAALAVKSRDNARTPMQWTDADQAGFTTGEPWLAANPNHTEINAEQAIADPDSVFHHYRRLIELRHTHDVIVHGRYALLLPDHEQVYAFTRTLGGQVVTVVANLSSTPVSLGADDLGDLTGAEVLLATHAGSTGPELAPWESRVLLVTAG